ncbi:molybdenum cofactor biosynthesis protein MoaE [Alteromonas arenosi]|uniref:molybdenum cofactor biosynthesis protein MoaE n=1 Tax=Alteromonas arenosi TaxID=3055817 RepID=UPI00334076C7
MDRISVQTEDFDVAECYSVLREAEGDGAIVTFTGIVRELAQEARLAGIELEHYPQMTHLALEKLVADARSRFTLGAVTIIHRVGKLAAHEQIVFVGVTSRHRQAAFDACQFLMDILKRDVPLWKKEWHEDGSGQWVAAKDSDKKAAAKW